MQKAMLDAIRPMHKGIAIKIAALSSEVRLRFYLTSRPVQLHSEFIGSYAHMRACELRAAAYAVNRELISSHVMSMMKIRLWLCALCRFSGKLPTYKSGAYWPNLVNLDLSMPFASLSTKCVICLHPRGHLAIADSWQRDDGDFLFANIVIYTYIYQVQHAVSGYNSFTGTIPNEWATGESFGNLYYVALYNNPNLTGTGVPWHLQVSHGYACFGFSAAWLETHRILHLLHV